MKYELKPICVEMGLDVFEMYQEIPREEIGTTNIMKGYSYQQYHAQLKKYKIEEKEKNNDLDTTTNRYIFYVNNIPVGEIGIRTSLTEFWVNRGSQIFYKIRISERNKGYGTKMLELALNECKNLGMEQVRINCDDNNISSRRIIEKNGGILDIKSYKTKNGFSSSFIIKI